jgi:hypothetical protein
MIVSAEHAFVVERHEILFEVTNDKHPPAQIQQRFTR